MRSMENKSTAFCTFREAGRDITRKNGFRTWWIREREYEIFFRVVFSLAKIHWFILVDTFPLDRDIFQWLFMRMEWAMDVCLWLFYTYEYRRASVSLKQFYFAVVFFQLSLKIIIFIYFNPLSVYFFLCYIENVNGRFSFCLSWVIKLVIISMHISFNNSFVDAILNRWIDYWLLCEYPR